jgi:large subunit ribosomal protein L26e
LSAPSGDRRKIMSVRLSKELRAKHHIRSIPVRVGDEVRVLKGKFSKSGVAKVIQVYRKRWVIHCEKFTRDKQNGQSVQVAIQPSNCVIEKLQLDQCRKNKIALRAEPKLKGKNKHKDVNMAGVD